MTENKAALDAALAQIDRAFGKEPAPARTYMKVWMDPFTEEHVRRWIRERVDGWLPDDFDEGLRESMWEAIADDMDAGEHRILDGNPLDRRYPPVTLGERIGLFFRRLFARWQRTGDQITEAEIEQACRRVARDRRRRGLPPLKAEPLPSLDNPPF